MIEMEKHEYEVSVQLQKVHCEVCCELTGTKMEAP